MADETELWGGKRWTLAAAGAIVIALVGAIAWIGLSSHTPAATASIAQRRQVNQATKKPCPLASVESTAIPSATAPPTKWIDVRGFEFPTTADGPLYRDGSEWTCFAHTPMGGLLTATSSAVAIVTGDTAAFATYFPPHHWSTAQLESQVPVGGQAPQDGPLIVGYEFGPWSLDGGVVSLVEGCSSGSCPSPYASLTVRVQWRNNRWYLVGDTFQPGTGSPLVSLAGVTPWEAP